MFINNISSVSFGASIPVRYYAKNPKNDKYVPVIKNENIKKCHGFLVRNLNQTAKGDKIEQGLVNLYRSYDSDYRQISKVHSVYRERGPVVYMVTGRDVDVVNQMAKPVGIAKSEAKDILGHSKSFDSMLAARTYQIQAQNFVDRNTIPVKSKDDKKPVEIHMYFNPEYKKRSGELKGFNFVGARFVDVATQEVKDEYIKE